MTFDDKIYDNYGPLILFIISACKTSDSGELDARVVYETFKKFNRLDALKYFTAYGDDNKAVDFFQLDK